MPTNELSSTSLLSSRHKAGSKAGGNGSDYKGQSANGDQAALLSPAGFADIAETLPT